MEDPGEEEFQHIARRLQVLLSQHFQLPLGHRIVVDYTVNCARIARSKRSGWQAVDQMLKQDLGVRLFDGTSALLEQQRDRVAQKFTDDFENADDGAESQKFAKHVAAAPITLGVKPVSALSAV